MAQPQIRLSLILVLLAVSLGLAIPVPARPGEARPGGAAATQPAAPSWSDLAELTWAGLESGSAKLDRGVWEGKPVDPGGASRPRVILARHFLLSGDLDGDGVAEGIGLLAESQGGSGEQLYLAVAARDKGGWMGRAVARVGDRVQVRSGRIEGRRIVLEVVVAGEKDAMCCPGEKRRRSWKLAGAKLEEEASEVTGALGIADIGGNEWVLRAFDQEPAPTKPEVTLVLEGNRIGGRGGCNRYFAEAKGETPGELRLGPIGSTRMACPEPEMALEQRFLGALAKVESFRFVAGRLVLQWRDGEAMRSLEFEARATTETSGKPADGR